MFTKEERDVLYDALDMFVDFSTDNVQELEADDDDTSSLQQAAELRGRIEVAKQLLHHPMFKGDT